MGKFLFLKVGEPTAMQKDGKWVAAVPIKIPLENHIFTKWMTVVDTSCPYAEKRHAVDWAGVISKPLRKLKRSVRSKSRKK